MKWLARLRERLFAPDDPLYEAAVDAVVDVLPIDTPDAAQVVGWFESASRKVRASGSQRLKFGPSDIPVDEYPLVTRFLDRCDAARWTVIERYVSHKLGEELRVVAFLEEHGDELTLRVDRADSAITAG